MADLWYPSIQGKPRDGCMADLGSVALEILAIGVDFCCMADFGTVTLEKPDGRWSSALKKPGGEPRDG